jgi:hypothetical protein
LVARRPEASALAAPRAEAAVLAVPRQRQKLALANLQAASVTVLQNVCMSPIQFVLTVRGIVPKEDYLAAVRLDHVPLR